jgi:hypothetical protein
MLCLFLFAHGGEVNSTSVIEIFSREPGLGLQERAEVDDLVDDIARMATTHSSLTGSILRIDQIIDRFFIVRHAGSLAILQEDPLELVFGGTGDVDLIRNPSQESFINKVRRVEVGGENQELFEGNFQFLTGVQG